MEEMYEIKVSELRKVTCKTEYGEMLKQRWERVRGELEDQWSRLRESIFDVGEEMRGIRRIREGMRRNESDCGGRK